MLIKSKSTTAPLSISDKPLRKYRSDLPDVFSENPSMPLSTLSKTYTYWALQNRSYPPLSSRDSVLFNPATQTLSSLHGKPNVFLNENIIKVHQVTRREFLAERKELSFFTIAKTTSVYVKYTHHAKPIIAQQSMRGCTAAAVSMLLKEHGKPIDFQLLRTTNFAQPEKMMRWIEAQNLTPLATEITSLEEAMPLLKAHGSAIITIRGDDFGIHTVVLDDLTKHYARLREPYHGWEVTIHRKALEACFLPGNVIQIPLT